MRRSRFVRLLVLLAAGCASPLPQPSSAPRQPRSGSFPADALVTQRAVLTVHGRQFALNGYLALSETGGRRLIVTEMFGLVLADVLVKRDGTVHVMRSSRMFRPAWIRRYVAADLECVWGGASPVVLARRGYTLEVRTVEIKPGPQPPELFDETSQATP
jgi:hypothetical protein